ncbi:AI-2E family transporter [Lysobacter xinjiangensis]|uniref:AI-2E family transporter n=1 Tax=Cognatilysobacter xinjiangensis TaxID=546892 RepID=A0ABQ3C3U5_9GAMM|nr:AI-2E family transporter [Lysobacter xinjiangensis]GGZ66465.1 AI-2E family transporter [Lysobacter xinjiangensis]
MTSTTPQHTLVPATDGIVEASATDPATAHPGRPRAPTAVVVLAVIATGFTLWAAQGLILPVLLAMFFALVGNPIIRVLKRIYVPRFLSALLVITLGFAGTVLLVEQLVQPATEWIREAPRGVRSLAPKLREMVRPVHEANQAAQRLASAAAAGTGSDTRVQVVRTETNDPLRWLMGTPKLLSSILAVVLLTFFFMVYGENLQRHALALLPTRQQQKITVDILTSIEREISRYVLTISVINAVVGVVIAVLLNAIGVPSQEALLWGTMAMLLNFAPYVGPLIGMLTLLLMGFLRFEDWMALAPAGIYLLVHTLEGQLLTPIVLGRSMRLSPLILILSLMVFGWLWSMIGLLLAVPLLVCVKLVLSRIDGMDGWARLLE